VEATFYVLLPVMLLIARKSAQIVIAATLWSLLITQAHFWATPWKPTAYFEFINQFPVFLIGISCALLIKKYPKRAYPGWMSGILLLIMIAVMPQFTLIMPQFPLGQRILQTHLVFALMAGLLCYLLHQGTGSAAVSKPLEKIGKVSFSMYLIHFALMAPAYAFSSYVTAGRGPGFFITYYLTLAGATFLCSTVTYLIIEAPFIRLSHRISGSDPRGDALCQGCRRRI
jgi:peptidoglycan/LPS O-acetylase OafA/YrhL